MIDPRLRRLALCAAVVFLVGGAPARSESSPPPRVHEVQAGESLWRIASLAIGDPTLWPAIYRANRDQIKDPTLLYPGQKLTIPEVESESIEAIRRDAESLLPTATP